MANRMMTFVGGDRGAWQVVRMDTITGAPLEEVHRIALIDGHLASLPIGGKWLLRGVTSHQRYTTRAESEQLVARQPALGRAEATCAALIPIRKSAAWWALAQDERREIFEAQSTHIATGLDYLPAIARKLHHCRDLGEPYDFLTWFEYAPAHASAFDELVVKLRRSEEWRYVEREIDIRLVRVDASSG